MAEKQESGRVRPPRPTIALPPRPSPEAVLGPGASPGPMTMVSRFFSDPDCRSFSQLLAGAMQSPAAAADGGGAGGEIWGFKRNHQPVDLFFTVPPGLSPSGLLNSPGFFSPQSPFGMSHQQALAQVTAQAALSQSHLHFESGYAPSSVTVLEEPSSTNQLMQPLISCTKSSFTQSSDIPSSDKKNLPTYLAVDKPANDGYSWRKYGQKQVKGSEYPRSYYKCTHLNCPVKKQVERSMDGQVSEIVYRGQHCHEQPPPNKRLKDGSDLNGKTVTQAKQEPVLHGQVENVNRSNETVSGRDQEPVELNRSHNQEEVDSEMTVEDNYDDNNEPNPKRRNMDTGTGTFEVASSQKTAAEPKIIVQTRSEVDLLDDGYRWRKYGQKVVKGNPHPRSYYRCTYGGCNVRKHVERANADPKAVITTYEGKHNHDLPAAKTNSHNTGNNNGMQQPKAAVVTGKKHALVKEMDCGNAQRPAVLQLKEEQVLV